jgi:hypothetical protein
MKKKKRFWKIAAPVFTVTVIFALWQDIALLYRYMQKKMFAREAKAMLRPVRRMFIRSFFLFEVLTYMLAED